MTFTSPRESPASVDGVGVGGVGPGAVGGDAMNQPAALRVAVNLDLAIELSSDVDLAALETAAIAEGRRAARQLYREALQTLDARAVAIAGGTRQRREDRWMATLAGRLRLSRYRVRVADGTMHPLDAALGLGRGEASPGLRDVVVALAKGLSYREIAALVTRLTGEHVSPQTCLRIVRASEGCAGDEAAAPRSAR